MWPIRNAQTDAPQRNVSGPCTIPGVSPLFHQGQRSGNFDCTPGACLSQQEAVSSVPFLPAGVVRLQSPWGTNINIAAAAERTSHAAPSRKIWCPAPSAQPQAVWGGDFKFGVPGSASGRVPQKHIGCAVTRRQTTQNDTSSCCWLTIYRDSAYVNT